VTLLFAVSGMRKLWEAYLRGLEKRAQKEKASAGGFFGSQLLR